MLPISSPPRYAMRFPRTSTMIFAPCHILLKSKRAKNQKRQGTVPVSNQSTTLEHLVRSPTVPKTTTRGACFRGKLYEGTCELYCKNAVTQVILSQRNLFSLVTNLYILSLAATGPSYDHAASTRLVYTF